MQLDGQVKLAVPLKDSQRDTNETLHLHPSTLVVSQTLVFQNVLKDSGGQEHQSAGFGATFPGPTRPFSKQTLGELREVVSKDHLALQNPLKF